MSDTFFQPVSGFDLPRFAGVPTFMRLPHVPFDHPRFAEVQIGLIGAPWDGGTTNRPGARHGPRQLRDVSTMIRAVNGATWVAPFDLARCADLGDVAPNPGDLMESMARMEAFYDAVIAAGIRPLTGGGDHLCSLPILRALTKKHGPVGLIHVDAHTDTNDEMFGEKIAHGTTFRRAVEEGLLDLKRVVQIGQRAQGYAAGDFQWGVDQGFRLVQAEQCWHTSLAPLMAEVRQQMGDGPVYLSFDIDSLDPIWAPGTGTPEVGGLTCIQALEIVRGCRGLNLIGADLVEVSPPYDVSGNTSQLAANLLYEMLCVLPGVKYA